MAKRTASSHRWLNRQRKDVYARRAREEGAGSRAFYKLEQLDQRLRLLKRGMRVLELGAAPGGWTRYVVDRVGDTGNALVVAVDPRPMSVPASVVQVSGEFGEPDADAAVSAAVADRPLDLVLSDMAPNISGVKAADQARVMGLVDLATLAALDWLRPGGNLVVKMFQGEGVDQWVADQRKNFVKVRLIKPDASRSDSREVYGVALDRRA